MLISNYNNDIQALKIKDSATQRTTLTLMQNSLDYLQENKFIKWLKSYKKPKNGIYLYGSVGVGKTYMADLFYNNAKVTKKRMHFFSFMQSIHAELRAHKGQKNPLKVIAEEWSKKFKLIFIDELMVYEVADAMLLGEMLKTLWENKVFLLITSNMAPDKLYENGLQRARFLNFIKFITQDFEILNCYAPCDYRRQKLQIEQLYWYPYNAKNIEELALLFKKITSSPKKDIELEIYNRSIKTKYCAKEAIWFDFKVLCNIPRCSLDYIEIATKFPIIFIDTVPIFNDDNLQELILFIQLVDVLYDKNIPLVICAMDAIDKLYPNGPMLKAFERTKSRLHDLQMK